ncbi:MAG: hypothetical protein LBJ93_01040 [Clostridiales bacterium]|jgi:hypothetical protein|nr:hypothetical protein [Clostridiales bacterium]
MTKRKIYCFLRRTVIDGIVTIAGITTFFIFLFLKRSIEISVFSMKFILPVVAVTILLAMLIAFVTLARSAFIRRGMHGV